MDVGFLLVALIVGFTAITVFSLMALLFVRRRERERAGKTIEELDAALNAAIAEINRLGALVKKDVDEKYKAVLFLYDLADEKKREIENAADAKAIAAVVEKCANENFVKLSRDFNKSEVSAPPKKAETTSPPPAPKKAEKPKKRKKQPDFANPKHKQIWDMRESGQAVSEIAKELGMGQGEVKLILDLADRVGE